MKDKRYIIFDAGSTDIIGAIFAKSCRYLFTHYISIQEARYDGVAYTLHTMSALDTIFESFHYRHIHSH